MDDLKIKEVFNELERQGISRRDALKLAGISTLAFLANPEIARADGPNADGKGVKILIVGGGAAGCTMANFVAKKIDNAKVTIIEPDAYSIKYQPGQTLIGAGVWEVKDILKESKDFFPKDAKWIQDRVVEFNPESNKVRTQNSGEVSYDYMIVATGLQLNYEDIDGLSKDMIGTNGIGSIYFPEGAQKTWELLQTFIEESKTKNVRGVFTQPSTPIKCGGAPKKIAFLTSARLKEAKTLDRADLNFFPASGAFFGVKEYNEATIKYFADRKLKYQFKKNLISVNADSKVATFKLGDGSIVDENYDFLHVVPPMSAPNVVKNSSLADEKGWVSVDKLTTHHTKFDNIFALGDSSNLPTSKSGAAIREQYKVLGKNLISHLNGKEMKEKYDGYTACPLITDLGKVMMAEFDYDKKAAPTLSFLDPAKERWLWWFVKVYVLKPMYFYGMLPARA